MIVPGFTGSVLDDMEQFTPYLTFDSSDLSSLPSTIVYMRGDIEDPHLEDPGIAMAIFPPPSGGDVPFAKDSWDKDHSPDRTVLLKTLPGAVKLVLHYSINPPPRKPHSQRHKPSVGKGIYLEDEPSTAVIVPTGSVSRKTNRGGHRKVTEIPSASPVNVDTSATLVVSNSSKKKAISVSSSSSTASIVSQLSSTSTASVVSRRLPPQNNPQGITSIIVPPKFGMPLLPTAVVTKRDADIAVRQDDVTNRILAQLMINQEEAAKDRKENKQQFALAAVERKVAAKDRKETNKQLALAAEERKVTEKRFAKIFGIIGGGESSAKRAKPDDEDMDQGDQGEEY
jgi:hypothetical protein